MKVIAVKNNNKYLCEINHTEIEKHQNLYYGKLEKLKEGDEIDLGAGHDFASDARDTLNKTAGFFSANKKMIETITAGINVFRREGDE